MATFYPYPTASHFDRDHYAPHRTQQQLWHNSFQSNFYDDYDEQPAWSSALSSGQSQPGSSSGSCSYSISSAVMTTPRSIYPVDAVYGELDFCRSPSNSSGSSLPANHEDQFTFSEDSSPTSTRPVTATTQEDDDDDMITDEKVVVKQEDDASCFIMELSAPQVQSTLVSQSLAPPIEVPLRATHASRKMRSMMSSFRCNPFAMHAGGDSAMAPDREEAKPHEEEPLLFEFQIENYIHDCPFDCDSDLLTLSMSCDTDEKKRPTLPKESLRAFSPSFELHSDSASAFGITSETELDPAASASSASVVGSEWGENDLEGPASASSYAPSEEPSSLSHRSTHDHDHARGRGLAQARLIKPSTARAQSWDLHHTSSTSKMLTGSQANAASYQDYQSDDSATVPHPNIPTQAATGLHFRVPHTPTSPTPPPTLTRPSSTVTNGRKRSHDDMTKGQANLPVNLTGPGRNASRESYPRRSHQRTGSASSLGTSQSFYSETSPLTSSPASPIIGATAVAVQSHSGHPSHVSQFSSRPLTASYGVHAAGDSNSAALTPTAQWSPQPRSNTLHYSATGIPCHTVGMPMNLTPRSCATAFNTAAVGAGLSTTNISTLPPLTSAHRRWSLPDNISTSHPQSYQAPFLA